jgi:hypothetical protein
MTDKYLTHFKVGEKIQFAISIVDMKKWNDFISIEEK